tara:strand:+ start:347 stop:961 length:615 start_codon:yes stop_codon:yes gene_type:complete
MQQLEVIDVLKKELNFSKASIEKLKIFVKLVLFENRKHNLIAKSTENLIWDRHILDSAQLVKFINFKSNSLSDLGSGAGFPGLVIQIFNKNKDFHVKLYEKSPLKRKFLHKVISELGLKADVFGDVRGETLSTDIVVCRAFKKLDQVIQVSREIAQKPYKLIILKGQNAQKDIKNSFKIHKYPYKLESSMTNKDSKIILIEVSV